MKITFLPFGTSSYLFVLFGLVGACACTNFAAAHGFPDPESPSFKFEQVLVEMLASAREAQDTGASQEDIFNATMSVYDDASKWPAVNKQTKLTACFWNGDASTQSAVIKSDAVWEKIANIHISYVDASNKTRICTDASSADIRISLDGKAANLDYDVRRPADGNWSLLGKQATFQPNGKKYLVTVNLPNAKSDFELGNMVSLNFLVRHELGHARALMHEHQRVACKAWFNINAIAADTHWTVQQTEAAVSAYDELNHSFQLVYVGKYDIQSVMQYNFKDNWYAADQPGTPNPCRRNTSVAGPSTGDLATLIAMYGAATQRPGPAQVAQSPDPQQRLRLMLERARIGTRQLAPQDVEKIMKVEGVDRKLLQGVLATHNAKARTLTSALDRLDKSLEALARIRGNS
jgi:hypothetical protein